MKTIEIKQKLVEEALDQLKAAQQDRYVQSTQNVIDELELALRQYNVVGRSEQLKCGNANQKHAKEIINKLTTRPQMKDDDGYYDFYNDELQMIEIVETYLNRHFS